MKVLAGQMEKFLIDSWITLPMEDREYCYTLQKILPFYTYSNYALKFCIKGVS